MLENQTPQFFQLPCSAITPQFFQLPCSEISYSTVHLTHSSEHFLDHHVGKWEGDFKNPKIKDNTLAPWKTTCSSHWLHWGQDSLRKW